MNEKLKGTKIGQWLLMAFREEKKRDTGYPHTERTLGIESA